MLFEFTKEVGGKEFAFEVRVSEAKATDKNHWHTVEKIIINGEKIEKEQNRYSAGDRYYKATLGIKRVSRDEKKFCIEVRGDTKKKICKTLGLKTREDTVNIVIDEFRDAWAKMEAEGKALMEKLAAEKQAKVDAEYTDDNTEIEVHNHSSYGFGSYDYGQSTRGKKYIKMTEKIRGLDEALEKYLDHTDWGDYSVVTYYKITIGAFEEIVNRLAEQTRIENEQKDIIEELLQLETDARRATMKVKILKEGRISGGDGLDFYAKVAITDIKTGETKRFNCRNLFDVGYVINPMYPVMEGKESGGIEANGYWETMTDSGWIKARKLTEVEVRMIDYLREFSPISTEIRL